MHPRPRCRQGPKVTAKVALARSATHNARAGTRRQARRPGRHHVAANGSAVSCPARSTTPARCGPPLRRRERDDEVAVVDHRIELAGDGVFGEQLLLLFGRVPCGVDQDDHVRVGVDHRLPIGGDPAFVDIAEDVVQPQRIHDHVGGVAAGPDIGRLGSGGIPDRAEAARIGRYRGEGGLLVGDERGCRGLDVEDARRSRRFRRTRRRRSGSAACTERQAAGAT